jgi:hypothetical protein
MQLGVQLECVAREVCFESVVAECAAHSGKRGLRSGGKAVHSVWKVAFDAACPVVVWATAVCVRRGAVQDMHWCDPFVFDHC